jgi:hypothetical protein
MDPPRCRLLPDSLIDGAFVRPRISVLFQPEGVACRNDVGVDVSFVQRR